MKTKLVIALFSMAFACVVLSTCGDDDDAGGGGADPGALMDALENPTGDVASAETAQGVSAAYGAQLAASSGAGKKRALDCSPTEADVEETCDCPAGGTETVIAHGDQSAFVIDYTFDACCESADECCWDGTGWVSGSADGEGSVYESCMSFDVTLTCPDATENGTILAQSCQDASGVNWYLVEYEGASYAVSGSYVEGVGGQWTIRDADTTWTCTEDATGAGSCTDGTDTYSWT